jgi:hypothetical protein
MTRILKDQWLAMSIACVGLVALLWVEWIAT